MNGWPSKTQEEVKRTLLGLPPKTTSSNRWKTAAKALRTTSPASNTAPPKPKPTPNSTGITESMTFKCTMIDPPPTGGYIKKKSYTKKSSCAMSSTPTKKSSCGAMSSKRPMSTKPISKTAKK